MANHRYHCFCSYCCQIAKAWSNPGNPPIGWRPEYWDKATEAIYQRTAYVSPEEYQRDYLKERGFFEYHDYQQKLEESFNQEAFWLPLYMAHFKDFVDFKQTGSDLDRQGADRKILLRSNEVVLVQEKIRFVDYGDIALEYLADEEKQIPGWIEKESIAQWLAYGIKTETTHGAFFMLWKELKQAWIENRNKWALKYPKPARAPNKTYWSLSRCIPIQEIADLVPSMKRYSL